MKAINKQCSELMRRSGELWRERDSDRRLDAKLMEEAANTIEYLKNEKIKLELENTKLHTHSQQIPSYFEENFYYLVVWCNEYKNEFVNLLCYLKDQQNDTSNDTYSIYKPKFITPENEIMDLYWMLLVYSFGNYGTSPRYGWIYRDKLDDCINHITEMINKTYGEGRHLCEE